MADQKDGGATAAISAEAYDAMVGRLEKVVAELEGGNLSLEQSIEKFSEGIHLAREAGRKLDEAERRIEILVKSADGVHAVPFDESSASPSGGSSRGP